MDKVDLSGRAKAVSTVNRSDRREKVSSSDSSVNAKEGEEEKDGENE